jgi:hypothetical protein
MANLSRKILWAVLGTAASKVVRNRTRKAMHTQYGDPRLPRPVKRRSGLGTAIALAAGTGALMALADVLSEQGKEAARAR